ncbi:MAG: PadR family transcriptional regulator [Candidatus Micrarchaeia archaeon]
MRGMRRMDEDEGYEGIGRGRMMGMGGRGMYGPHEMHGMMHMGRGFIGLKYLILRMANEGEVSGSQIIEAISSMTNGYRRPSPGNVYPTLRDLEEEGYLKMREEDHVKYYQITDKGKEALDNISMPMFGMRGAMQSKETSEHFSMYNISAELDRMDSILDYLQENSSRIKDDADLGKRLDSISKKISSIRESKQ